MSFEVEYYTLLPADATNQYITLNQPLTDNSNVALDIIGGTSQAINNDFTCNVDTTTLSWDNTSLGLYGALSAGDQLRIIYDSSAA